MIVIKNYINGGITMYEKVITLLVICSCLIFSACYAEGYSSSRPATKPAKSSTLNYEWELNVNTSELEYCTKRGIARYCL